MARGLFLSATLLAGGCTTTRQVTRPDNVEEMQALANAQTSTVTVLYAAPLATADDGATESGSGDRTAGAALVGITPTGPVVASSGSLVQLKFDDLHGYQVRRPYQGALEGLGIGLLAGVALGGVIGYSRGDDPACTSSDPYGCSFYWRATASEKAVLGGVLAGVGGAIVGGIVGLLTGHTDAYVF